MMQENPKNEETPQGPRIFLVLAALMMVLAVLSYTFEDWLFDLYYSAATFVYAITISVLLGLFFLYCYRVPRIGYKLLGRRLAADRDPEPKVASVTYDIFKDEMPSDTAMRHHKRMEARHLRHRLAREAEAAKAPPEESD
jgi:hypothetical protein